MHCVLALTDVLTRDRQLPDRIIIAWSNAHQRAGDCNHALRQQLGLRSSERADRDRGKQYGFSTPNRMHRYSSHVALILAIGPILAHFLACFAAR